MGKQKVTMYFDATCPFAWVTSRWLKEVEKVRDVELVFAPMSLSVLNDGRDLPEDYMRRMEAAWAPARVAAAIYTDHPEAIDEYYTQMGQRIHDVEGVDVRDPHGFDATIADVVEHLGLPDSVAQAAHRAGDQPGSYEPQLRQYHTTAIELVGDDVGTPVVQLGDVAFFGPVLTRVPTGEQAGKMFDAAVELAAYPHFFEMKRSRTERPANEKV